MSAILIYITTPDLGVAQKISRTLLKKKLIACSNIIPLMHSHYSWKGKLESSRESILILKTISKNFKTIEKVVLKIHPYDTPCILSLKVDQITKKYMSWLTDSVSK